MTTHRLYPDHYTSDEFIYKKNSSRSVPHHHSSHPTSKGIITKKTKNGSYNIIEKDFGDHKIIYHVPVEYGDDYDTSELDDIPSSDHHHLARHSPQIPRRRIYQEYDDYDYDDDDYEYVEEIPVVAPRRRVYVSPRRPRETQVIHHIYHSPSPPPHKVEYIYEDDHSNVYDHTPREDPEVEYVVREPVPKQTYMEEPRPIRRQVYAQDPPSYSPYQPTSRTNLSRRTPSPIPIKPSHRNDITPPPPARKQPIARSSPIYEPPVRQNIPKASEPPLRLMDIVAQNRARRGTRIPKPRREVDEERIYDPPTYNRNIIKNGFVVHK